jgi:hypothetical protein
MRYIGMIARTEPGPSIPTIPPAAARPQLPDTTWINQLQEATTNSHD